MTGWLPCGFVTDECENKQEPRFLVLKRTFEILWCQRVLLRRKEAALVAPSRKKAARSRFADMATSISESNGVELARRTAARTCAERMCFIMVATLACKVARRATKVARYMAKCVTASLPHFSPEIGGASIDRRECMEGRDRLAGRSALWQKPLVKFAGFPSGSFSQEKRA